MNNNTRRTSTNKQNTALHKPTRCDCCKAECNKLHRVRPNTFYCPECRSLYKDWTKYNKGASYK